MMSTKPTRIRWASRVDPLKIRRLYESDAQGMLDRDLLNDVGYGIYVRCREMLEVAEAFQGRVKCWECGNVILRQRVDVGPVGDKEEVLTCERCAWQITWGDYHKSLSGQSLHACGCEDLFASFAREWLVARSPQHKMLLIDNLIHAFHVWDEGFGEELGASVGRNVIAATDSAVIALINELAYGTQSTAGLQKTRQLWSTLLKRKTSRLRKSDLQAIARELDIVGRSRMRRAELQAAIEQVAPNRLTPPAEEQREQE
jgi:hypothetical protein